jgi:hypothetical protein
MLDIEARLVDLIKFSSNQNPIEFEDTFKSILQDRVASAIDNKKAELASRMFSPAQEIESEDEGDIETSETEDEEDAQAT